MKYASFAPNGRLTLEEPTLEQVVTNLCLRAGMSTGQFDATALAAITTPVHGLIISALSNTRAIIQQLASVYFFEARLSDKLYFFPRRTTSSGSVPFADLAAASAGSKPVEPLPLTQKSELEIPSQISLTYVCEQNDYQSDTQYSDRLISSQVNMRAIQVPLNLTPTEAKKAVEAILLDQAYGSLSASITLDMRYAHFEPGDILTLHGQTGEAYVMRIVTKKDGGGIITYDLVNDESSVLIQAGNTATSTSLVSQNSLSPVPLTKFLVMDLPSLTDSDSTQPGWYVAVDPLSNKHWSGAVIDQSLDDTTWSRVAEFSKNTVTGVIWNNALPTWNNGDNVDHMNYVDINVGAANSLSSISREQFLNDHTLNLAWLGAPQTVSGVTVGELFRFQNAELIDVGIYRLTNFHRGLYNTEAGMSTHDWSDQFVLLASNSGVKFCSNDLAQIGRGLFYRCITIGAKAGSLNTQTFMPRAANLRPFSPVNLRANRATTDTVFTWSRRTRLVTRFVGEFPIGAPLGESAESYLINIYADDAFTLKRTVTVSSPTWTYTLAMQIADFGAAQANVYMDVAQISSYYGAGKTLYQYT